MGQTRTLIPRYTRPALADLGSILDYIAARSPQGAHRVQARIQTFIELLLLPRYRDAHGRTDDPSHDGLSLSLPGFL